MIRIFVRGFLAPMLALRRGAAMVRDRRALYETAGRLYHDEIVPETWASNGYAIGELWKATVDGRRALDVTGALKLSISWMIEGVRLLIGTPLRYGITHQHVHAGEYFDGVIRPKNFPYLRFRSGVGGGWARKKEVRIPRRIFLKLPLPVLQRIGAAWVKLVRSTLRGTA